MGHLFLDIEVYVGKYNLDAATNPYHDASKVLLISYNYYDTFQPPIKAEIKPPVILKEWEGGEKVMLEEFLAVMKGLLEKDPYMKVHGFNILKLDLPYLFGRMAVHKIAPEKELHRLLYRPFGTDMMQLAPLLTEERRAKEQLWGMSQKDVNKFFGMQSKEGTGLETSLHYDHGEYDKVVARCLDEFNFEQLLNSFYLYAYRLTVGEPDDKVPA